MRDIGNLIKATSLRAVTIFGVAFFAAGCSLLGGGSKPLTTYALDGAELALKQRRTRTQILIAEPVALKVFDSQNIVVRPDPSTITYLDGVQWEDNLPKVVQATLIESFQTSGAIVGVGRPGEGLAIDYQITSDVRAFEVHAYGASKTYVEIAVRILDDRNGVVRHAKVFKGSRSIAGNTSDSFIKALNATFKGVAGDVVKWVVKQI